MTSSVFRAEIAIDQESWVSQGVTLELFLVVLIEIVGVKLTAPVNCAGSCGLRSAWFAVVHTDVCVVGEPCYLESAAGFPGTMSPHVIDFAGQGSRALQGAIQYILNAN